MMASSRNLSAAKNILAILWHIGAGTTRDFFNHPYYRALGTKKHKNTYQTALSRLESHGLIQKKTRGVFTLTPDGRKEALFAYVTAETRVFNPKYSKWDGGWRIIFFDIPETKRKQRDYLRSVLKTIGFKEWQKSIWAYPYQVPSFLRDLLFQDNLKQHTRFVTTESVDYDQDLRKKFGLR